MTEAANWAVIPAAGVGRRMGAGMPKQYLRLGDRTVLDHALERLLLHPQIDGVYVAVAAADALWREGEFAAHPDVVWVEGGDERCRSVLNALDALRRRAEADDWVLVHDAARPLVRRGDIDRLIVRCREQGVGGLLGRPVSDSMKRVEPSGAIRKSIERDGLWHAYTPQMFPLGHLHAALTDAVIRGLAITDEAGAMELAGHHPLMVAGRPDNLKITQPGDLALAEYYLSRQSA